MSGVRERARILQEETEKLGKNIDSQQNGELLSGEDQKALEKVRLPHASLNISKLTRLAAPERLR